MPNVKEMKQIPGHPLYYLTRDGRIFSYAGFGTSGRQQDPHELKRIDDVSGYYLVCLGGAGGGTRRVHRLMLETYMGQPGAGMECRHLNGNKKDNRIENLAWGTRQENAADSHRLGVYCAPYYGEDCPLAKLTMKQVLEIRSIALEGHRTQADIGRQFGIHQCTVSRLIHGKRWTRLLDAGGHNARP